MNQDDSSPNQIEELQTDEDNGPTTPLQAKESVRNLIGFWLLGLCNNYPYVIMLSAAFDLLHPDYHNDQEGISKNSTNASEPLCNEVSTGAILLADILPSLFIKIVSPFLLISTQIRVMISVVLCVLSFLLTSLSFSNWVTFLGVICAALSSGLGEVTFLAYSSYFNKDVISTWSSGTGGAGVIGALSYASLTHFFAIRPTLQIMLIMPLLTVITFWFLLEHPFPLISNKLQCCNSERKPILENEEFPTYDISKTKQYSLRKKISLIKPLLKYMVPLSLVYFSEYFINQGLMELLYFPNAKDWLSHKNQYRWYQVDYQVGVLISRSSVNIFQVKKLWILPILQVVNLIILLLNVCFNYIPIIWIVLAVIFYEGLLGGCAYVNTFYQISIEIVEDREFSLGVASLGDSIGIALAGVVALPVHDALCKML